MPSIAGTAYLHLGHGQDARIHGIRYANGLVCDASPYGFHRAHMLGWRVSFSEDAAENAIVNFLRRGLKRCLGFDILHAYRNRRHMYKCDVVWTMSEYEWIAVAILQTLGVIPKRPMIGNSIWLFDKWHHLHPVKKRLYGILASRCAILTVHSNACLPIARTAFPSGDVRLMYFGIPTSTYRITDPVKPAESATRRRILAIGNDKTRDWETVVAAFGNNPHIDLTLICLWAPRKYEKLYRNLTIKRSVTGKEFTGNYAAADIVIVSMRENVFSGITVLLEAVACGKPVISTRTGGCPTYFDEDEVTYVPCNDPVAMRNAALDLGKLHDRAKKAQAKFLAHDYSTIGMIASYSALTKEILTAENGATEQLARMRWSSGHQVRELVS